MSGNILGKEGQLGFMAGTAVIQCSGMENECSPLTTRVLLVEDHEGFRSYVRSALLQRKDLELVGVAGDGLEAVEKCRELQPDLVLMDIGLPRLNGLDAARRILAEFPQCRIVFLTQEHAPEILEEALKLGASGYVLKTRAARDLFPAMQTARHGGAPHRSCDDRRRRRDKRSPRIRQRSR